MMWWAWGLVVLMFVVSIARWWIRDERHFNKEWAAELIARADQQTAWLAEGDPRGIYGDYLPPAIFLEPEQCELAVKPSNDGTPLLTRAAAMLKRVEYVENLEKRCGTAGEADADRLACVDFLIRCADREQMTYQQFVRYVHRSMSYARAGDGSVPLSALDRRSMQRIG